MSAPEPNPVLGSYRGGRYTRAYALMFWLLAAAALVLEQVVRGSTVAAVIIAVVAAIGAVVIHSVAQSVLTADGLRLVLLRQWVPWTTVARVVAPEAGDTEVRLELHDGTLLTARGVPVDRGPAVARLLGGRS